MFRKLFVCGLAAMLLWPTSMVLADDDDDALLRLEQRVNDLENELQTRISELEATLGARITALENAPDADTLASLSCTAGQIAKFNGTGWFCAADEVGPDSDTLRDLACADGEIAAFDGNAGLWVCATPPGGGTPDVIVVGAGGSPFENCDNLRAALDSITGGTNLVRLEAGIYDCGGLSLDMKPGVDLEGAGASATRILGNPDATDAGSLVSGGVINGANGMEIRALTVEHTGSNMFFSIGIDNLGADMRITDVDVVMTNQFNVDFGIVAVDAQPAVMLRNVRVEAGTVGILTGTRLGFESTADFGNVTVMAREAMSGNFGGSAVVRDSVLSGSELSLRTAGTSFSFTATQLAGPVDASQGPGPQCDASFDADFVPLDETCGTGITQTAQ